MSNVEVLQKIIDNSKNIVFFGGAGVSTESGIPDFRSVDGIYNQRYDFPPEEILSHHFFLNNTKEFYRFYRDKMLCTNAMPNSAHIKCMELEKLGKLSAIITQNIDGLHQKAGSKKVYELHGSVHRNYCMKCHKFFNMEYIKNSMDIPLCDECNSIIKPDVVLYEEGLDDSTVNGSLQAIENADTMIVAGTSLTVYPAAGMIRYFKGKHLLLINRDITNFDNMAEYVFRDKVGELLRKIKL